MIDWSELKLKVENVMIMTICDNMLIICFVK